MIPPKRIIAIDPGVSAGGIAIWQSGRPVQVVRMPRDLAKLKDYFLYLASLNIETIAFVEAINLFASDQERPGMQYSIKKLTDNQAQIKAFLTMAGFPFMEVYPNSWQSRTGLKEKTKDCETDTERKNVYKQFAQNCFPETKVTLWKADALCIVQFALSTYTRDSEFITSRLQNVKDGMF